MKSSLAVLEVAIWILSFTLVYDKIMIENQKKSENMEIKEIFLYKSPSNDSLVIEFTANC